MNVGRLLLGLILAVFAQHTLAADRYVLATGEHWLAATVDHRDVAFTILTYQPPSGEPWLRVIDLDQLALRYASGQPRRHRGENYVLPGALTDYEVHFDPLMERAHFVTHIRPHSPEDTPADLLLDIRVNDVLIDQPLYVQNTGSDLVLPKETLEALRVALPDAYGPFLEDDMPVHALAGEMFYLAPDRLYLEMTVRPNLFTRTELAPGGHVPPGRITDWSPSMVFGYDLAGGESAAGERWQSGFGDLAVSTGTLTCRSRHLYRSELEDIARLASECIVDWPSVPLSAGAGDHYTAPGALQQVVAYGGFWIGTDYSLQPYRNLQPSLIVDGNARLPSTLEIWMDQRLGLRQQIPPGPFIVENLPAVTGSGLLRAELVDATGRQVLVSAPVYSDPRLLQPGVADWRVEGGRLRPGGLINDDLYTERFASASARVGITDWLTGEVHAEGTDALSTWSASTALRAWRLGLFEFGISRSRTDPDDSAGEATLLGYTYRGDRVHAGFREIRRDSGYVSLGYPQAGDAPTRERVASVGISAGLASLTLTGLERVFDDRAQKLGSAALAIRLGSLGQLLLTATRDLETPDSEPMYGAHLSIPFGRRSHAYHSVSDDGTENMRTSTGYSISAPPGSGTGFRVNRDALGDDERYFAQATFRGNAAVADLSMQTDSEYDPSWGTRLSGAVIASRAGVGLSRDDGDSFAVIRTAPGADDVRILREHQVATRTGNSGNAIVPGLRPYQSNRIALQAEDLPLAGEVDRIEMPVVAGRRGVVTADYGYRQERKLLGRLRMAAGAASEIPAGTQVLVNGTPAGIAGFDGTIYVTLPAGEQVRIEALWKDGYCTVTTNVPLRAGVHEAGDLICKAQ